ncbi:hypothetical protein NCCP2140_38150 [Pseudoalteromonas sp. NCCP-2140]|nr:hypothetical protein NCCP2140_38150 [Pseudoalteromonas sp. NCCP-2140]
MSDYKWLNRKESAIYPYEYTELSQMWNDELALELVQLDSYQVPLN